MKSVSISGVLVSAIILFAVNSASAQLNSSPKPTHLALEVIARSDIPAVYHPVPGPDSAFDGAWLLRLGRIAGWRPAEGSLPVKSVRVVSKLGADGVRVIVSVQFGTSVVQEEKYAADYIAREGEKTTIATLKQFGVEPIQITLVRVTPTALSPPTISNHTKSIEVVSVEAAHSTLPAYVFTLRNPTAQDLKAFAFHLTASGKEILRGQLQNPQAQPIIAAGDTVRTEPIGPRSGAMTPGGYQPALPSNPEFVISTAVFADNSFEGNEIEAAMIVSRDQGRKAQLERLIPLLREAAKSEDKDLLDTLAKLRNEVAGLPNTAPPAVSTKLTLEFGKARPGLIVLSIEGGANLIKREVLNEITVFQEKLSKSIGQRDFARWIPAMIEKYDGWLSRLH